MFSTGYDTGNDYYRELALNHARQNATLARWEQKMLEPEPDIWEEDEPEAAEFEEEVI